LTSWLDKLEQKIMSARQNSPDIMPPLKILLKPEQQIIGDLVYEVAFIADTDGLPLEFIRVLSSD